MARAKPASLDLSALEPEEALWPYRSLSLTLPGVVTWKRPRMQPVRGGRGVRTAYPPEYAAQREAWAFEVAVAVRQTGWVPPPVGERLRVDVTIVSGGKWDCDRIVTAVLDALQGGGALVDDCRVWAGSWQRRRPERDEVPHVDVVLKVVDAQGREVRV